MNENLTELVCIVDRSGSMEAIRDDAIGGFNRFLEDQQQAPGEARFTLVLFNNEYELVQDRAPIDQVRPLTGGSYVPSGTTALMDAVGRTITDVGVRLSKAPDEDLPAHVIFGILTDGMENASSDYTLARVSSMIAHQQETYKWDFVYLAANQDAFQTGRSMSIQKKDVRSFESTPEGVREAFSMMSSEVSQRRMGKN